LDVSAKNLDIAIYQKTESHIMPIRLSIRHTTYNIQEMTYEGKN